MTQTVTTTQAASTTQTIATDECNVTITTNKHGNLTLNRVCTNMNGDQVSLGKKNRDSVKFNNVNKLLDPKITKLPKLPKMPNLLIKQCLVKKMLLKVSFVSMLFVSNSSQSCN